MSEKKSLLQEFKEFVTSGDLMSIAVAFIMASILKDLINSFITNIFTGILGLFIGCEDVTDAATGKVTKDCTGFTEKAYETIMYGQFINDVIVFVLTAFVVFMIVKAYKKSTKRQLAQEGPSDNDLLKEILTELRSQRNG